jgi:LmbE family N-acetylglucosaminyl deacetylase
MAHHDDALLSCYRLLAEKLLPQPVADVVAFSVSEHWPNGEPRPRRDLVAPIRREAERQFCRHFGAVPISLGLTDRPLPSAEPDAQIVRDICREIIGLLDRHHCRVVVAPHPRPQRQHTHHAAVYHAAAGAVAARSDCTLLLVDDVPYSRSPVGARVLCNGAVYKPFVLELSGENLQRKTEALRRFFVPWVRAWHYEAIRQPAPGHHAPHSETVWLPENLVSKLRDAAGDAGTDLKNLLDGLRADKTGPPAR